MESCNGIVVFTQILIIWSIINKATISTQTHVMRFLTLYSFIPYFFLAIFEATLNVA